jgi:hypothetical protein
MVPKESQTYFQINLEKGLKWKGGENGLTQKYLKFKMFFSSKDIHSLYYEILFGALFFSLLFFNTSSLFFSAPSLYFRILKLFQEKTNFKFFFGWVGSGYTMNMKVGELWIY